jgi:hypothetical protein
MKVVRLLKLVIQPVFIVVEDDKIVSELSSEKPIQVYEKDIDRIHDVINEVSAVMANHVTKTQG